MSHPRKHRATVAAIAGTCAVALTAGVGSVRATSATTAGTTAGSSGAAAGAWAVSTDDCVDPDAANKKIEGTLNLGSIMPLSGGGPAILFAPVKDGFNAYIGYANEQKMLGDVKINVMTEDDQYKAELTPGALTKLLDAKADVISAVIGTPDNEAIRQTLNDNCIPQLNALTGAPQWGEPKDYPWTTGGLVPYTIETKAYVADIAKSFPDGAKVGLFYVNSDFGKVYADTLKELAAENKLEIVDEQTVEASDSNPPVSQATSLASKKPDVIFAVPLGLGCPAFLKEIAAKKAADTSWNPRTYVTATCASPLLMGAAGDAAEGMLTSTNLKDVTDATVAAEPGPKAYLDFMKKLNFSGDVSVATTGWAVGELTVAILRAAQKSPEGLTRASIINAARNLDYHASLQLDGANYVTNGDTDPYPAESLQLRQFTGGKFVPVGDLITSFESK